MDRTTIGVSAFLSVACVAMVTMIVTGKSRHPRTQVAATQPASESSRDAATQAGAPTRTSNASRPPDPADMESQVGGMRMPPPGYHQQNAQNFMRMRLRELMMAEEQAYQETNSYTTDLSKLMLAKRTGDVVILRVTFAGPAGWSAEATHPAMPGKSCVVYAGPVSSLPRTPETLVDHIQPLGERDLVCDKP
jgi:hypothetical protein